MAINLPPIDKRPDYFTTTEFGALFGRSRRWTQLLLKQGKIKSVRIGSGTGQNWIPANQIERLINQDSSSRGGIS